MEQKKILWMFSNSSACGQSKLVAFDLPYKTDIEYFHFCSVYYPFECSRLPIDLSDEELKKSIKPYPYNGVIKYIIRDFNFIKNTDFSKYEKVVVWYNNDASALIFLYMLCKFIPTKLYIRNYGEKEPVTFKEFLGHKNVRGNLFTQMENTQDIELPEDIKQNFAKLYDSISGRSKCFKKAEDMKIIEVPDDELYTLLLKQCRKTRFRSASLVIGQTIGKFGLQISSSYLEEKLMELVFMGKVIAKQRAGIDGFEDEIVMYRKKVYNGVYVSVMRYYDVKLV